MRDWHHNWKTDVGLRLCGLTSCGASYLAIRTLMALKLPDGQLPQTALPFLLAAIGFLSASAGAVLLFLGHYIFDEVEVSQPWRTMLQTGENAKQPEVQIGFESTANPHSFRSVSNQDNTRDFDSIRRA